MPRLRRSSATNQSTSSRNTSSRNTSGPHQFVEPEDVRPGLALSSTSGGYQMVSAAAVASAGLRTPVRALSGCGKSPGDPIHWPAE